MTTSGDEDDAPIVPPVGWVNWRLNDEVHARAKARAALLGKDLYPYLSELIERGVEEDEAEAQRKRKP